MLQGESKEIVFSISRTDLCKSSGQRRMTAGRTSVLPLTRRAGLPSLPCWPWKVSQQHQLCWLTNPGLALISKYDSLLEGHFIEKILNLGWGKAFDVLLSLKNSVFIKFGLDWTKIFSLLLQFAAYMSHGYLNPLKMLQMCYRFVIN